MTINFIQVATAAGFTGGNENTVANWGQIRAKKAGESDTNALLVTTLIQGLAIEYCNNVYTVNSLYTSTPTYTSFTTTLHTDAFKFIVDNTLEASLNAAAAAAITFTNDRQLEAMKFIHDNLLLSDATTVAGAKLYVDNTKLLDLIINQDHTQASVKSTVAATEAKEYETEEWDELVEQNKHQVRSGDDATLLSPHVAVFGKNALTSAEGLTNLDTTAKTSIVAAINEVKATADAAGGGFDTAGTGLTNSGTTVNVIGGDGIVANANDVTLDPSTGGAGLTYTTGVLAVVATDTSILVNADDLKVNIGTIDSDGAGGGTSTHPAGLEITDGANSGTAGLGVKVDGTTVGFNTATGALTVPLQVRKADDSDEETIDIIVGGTTPTGAGNGLSNLNEDLHVRDNIVSNINSLFTQKPSFLASLCATNSAIAVDLTSLFNTALENSCAGTTSTLATSVSTSTSNTLLSCLEYVSHIANGISSGTSTINAATATECRTRFGCAIDVMDTGNLKTAISGNSVFSGHLEAEVCGQFYI